MDLGGTVEVGEIFVLEVADELDAAIRSSAAGRGVVTVIRVFWADNAQVYARAAQAANETQLVLMWLEASHT
jgi:hypothetical protein